VTHDAFVATKVIWMRAWEFECSAEEFRVGSRVTWMLAVGDQAFRARMTAVVGEAEGERLTHYETHHGPLVDDPLTYVTGTVTVIKKVFESDPTSNTKGPYYIEDRAVAEKFEDPMGDADPRFLGYLIDLGTTG
jgi:hypothetical protein